MLTDSWGRIHRNLRISLTDRCNLRCRYCLPEAGVDWLAKSEMLTTAEIVRVVQIAAGLGVRSVRLTGGEPLLNPDVVEVVAALGAISPKLELSMTTNGIRLAAMAKELKSAGLTRLNISLDTLVPDIFTRLTGRNQLAEVLAGIAATAEAGFTGTKINTVLLRGINDGEVLSLVRWAGWLGLELRFIEQMPLDPSGRWSRANLVSSQEVFQQLAAQYSLTILPGRGAAPAERYLIDGGPGVVGFIASVTQPFCGACDRIRLTADGQLRNCLFAHRETDLRTLLRTGAPDSLIAQSLQDSVATKPAGHGINNPGFLQPKRPMNAIGG